MVLISTPSWTFNGDTTVFASKRVTNTRLCSKHVMDSSSWLSCFLGLTNSLATFQMMMNHIFCTLIAKHELLGYFCSFFLNLFSISFGYSLLPCLLWLEESGIRFLHVIQSDLYLCQKERHSQVQPTLYQGSGMTPWWRFAALGTWFWALRFKWSCQWPPCCCFRWVYEV